MSTAHTATPRFAIGDGGLSVMDLVKKPYTPGTQWVLCRTANATDARFIVRVCNAHDALVEYFNASKLLQMTLGHPEATVEDEHKAEARYEAATDAARAALTAAQGE